MTSSGSIDTPNTRYCGAMALCTSSPSSRLNPNAPFFVPAAFCAVEDFSADWWKLVENSPAFREYWLAERFDPDVQLASDFDMLGLLEMEIEFLEEEADTLPSASPDPKELSRLVGLNEDFVLDKHNRKPFSPLPYQNKPLKVSQPPKPALRKIQQPR
ncbi:hypothetical protein KP509_08G064000 [Ceratopteris richardii]|uniref:Ataxin-2 C-terminal domain-containing protein n=1 Tax=Ceratopteris richardii TaxID=49495 RepID=A0A8T2UDX8_CERRI|nr:hypothetical protein KP509_08G064000 [Ceratopteris richardii]